MTRLLLTPEQRELLLQNGRQQRDAIAQLQEAIDFKPVVRLYATDTFAIWLLSEIDVFDPDLAFGLCEIGIGCAEVGHISLTELAKFRGPMQQPVTRDDAFLPSLTLDQYTKEARSRRRFCK